MDVDVDVDVEEELEEEERMVLTMEMVPCFDLDNALRSAASPAHPATHKMEVYSFMDDDDDDDDDEGLEEDVTSKHKMGSDPSLT